jgi:threonine dehydratase
VGAQVFLKFENLQFTASFKERGACNKLTLLTRCLQQAECARGVVAMSAGNHAQGVAYHAQRLGLRAVIVMPRFTPGVKVERTRGFGAEVVLHGDTLEEARAHAYRLADSEGLTFVHPYDDEAIAAGQGTLGLEMLRAVPDLDTLVIAVGGGGLISGVATAAKALRPGIEVMGVQTVALSGHGQRRQGHAPPAGHQHHCRGHCRGHAGQDHTRGGEAAGGRPGAGGRGRHRAGGADAAGDRENAGGGRGRCGAGGAAALPRALSGPQGGAGAVRRQHRPAAAGGHHRARHGALGAAGAHPRELRATFPGVLARITATVADAGANIDEVHHQRAFTRWLRRM